MSTLFPELKQEILTKCDSRVSDVVEPKGLPSSRDMFQLSSASYFKVIWHRLSTAITSSAATGAMLCLDGKHKRVEQEALRRGADISTTGYRIF